MSALREILAHFSFEVDDKKLHEAGEGIEGMIEKVKTFAAAAAAAFMIKEVFEFAHGMAEAAIEVEHSAAAFGLSTTEMQQWQLAAKASGVSSETLDTSFKMLAKNVGTGMGPGVEALAKLGVNVKDASGNVRPMGDLFEDAGAAVGGIENAGKRAAIGTQVFGRQFIKILPLISKGKEGMAELRNKLEELGGGFDKEFIEKSKEVEEQSAFLGQGWTSLKVTLAAYLLPALTWLMTKGVELVKVLIDLAKNTEIVKVAAIALGAIGIGALSALIGPLGAAFGFLLTTVLPLVAAFILVEDFLTFLSGGESLFGDAIESIFGPGAAEKVRNWFNSVGKELSDIGQDFRDLKLYFEVLWESFKDLGLLAAAYLSDGFDSLWANIKNAALKAAAYMSDAFDNVIDGLPGVVKTTLGITGGGGHAVADIDAMGQDKGGTAVADIQAMMAREQQTFVAKFDASHNVQTTGGRQATEAERGGAGGHKIDIHVNVPPGTPETIAHRAGEASKRGTMAALVPGSG